MTQEMKSKIKEVLESAGITFLATFLLATLPYLSDVTMESVKTGATLSLIIAAARVAVKEAILIVIPFIKSLKK